MSRLVVRGSGGGIRTLDLWVMSPTSCRCSTPRHGGWAPPRGGLLPIVSGRVVGSCGPVVVSCRPDPSWLGESGMPATASPPTGLPRQYSPALRRGTTGFGMGPGGCRRARGHGHPRPPRWGSRDRCGGCPQHRVAAVAVRVAACCCVLLRVAAAAGERPAWEEGASRPPSAVGGKSPSAIRTARLRSVTRRPPAAYPPGGLPGALPARVLRRRQWGASSRRGIPT